MLYSRSTHTNCYSVYCELDIISKSFIDQFQPHSRKANESVIFSAFYQFYTSFSSKAIKYSPGDMTNQTNINIVTRTPAIMISQPASIYSIHRRELHTSHPWWNVLTYANYLELNWFNEACIIWHFLVFSRTADLIQRVLPQGKWA